MRIVLRILACASIAFGAAAAAQEAHAPSAAGERVYESARGRLVQVRTLLKGQDSQASVGSGFLVSDEGHLITNYHVVSDAALEPQRHRLVYGTSDGQRGALQLLAVDVVNDLALLRAADPKPLAGRGALSFRPGDRPPARGERVYALGNPLDIGFAVVEGTYNGLAQRSFVPTIFFGGSLSPGMSGGPALDDAGRVMGVNVATRRDGEQVSFLVPAAAAQALLERGRNAAPTEAFEAELVRQLVAHQEHLVSRFLAEPWRTVAHFRYAIPVPREDFIRCWGSTTPAGSKGLEFERSDCEMDSRVFVSRWLTTGHLSVRHEAYDGRKLGALRFAERYSAAFRNESFGARTTQLTAPACREGDVAAGAPAAPAGAKSSSALPLRVVMCLRAYRKLPGLYDLSVLAATIGDTTIGAQGRFDARGVTYDNALRLAAHYLQGYAWRTPNNASH